MGSSPESVRFLLQQLQCRPHSVCWSAPHPVLLLRRGHNHKLGFHFKTLPLPDSTETVTVVVKVKEDCCCGVGSGSLQVGDRIVRIGNVLVTTFLEPQVMQVFSRSQDPAVHLLVAAMSSSQVKRFPSMNSGASGGSQTASVDSGERPKPKRFQKSSSTETPPPTSPTADLAPRGAGPGAKVIAGTPPPPRRQQPCAARECAAYNRPPHPQRSAAPHHHLLLNHPPHPQYHSLPDRMEDDIILPDDIVLCEADGPNSLPPVLTPLPNTPTPSHPQSPGTAFVNTVSTGIGGEAVGGSLQQQQQQQQRSLGVDVCRAPGCSMQRMCLWHKFVLTHPQYVIWEPVTKKVVLEKQQDQSSFGFKYKVKKYDGPPAEVFALVTEVMAGGVAWNLLLSGDWIRSINGIPVNTAKEAFSPDFRNLTSLRLMIQRPEGLSWKGVPKLKGLAHSSGISLHIPVTIPLEAASPPPLPPADNPHLPPAAPTTADLLKSKYLDRHPGAEEGCRTGAREQNGQQGVAFFEDPLLEQYPRQAQSPGEHIPLNMLSRPALLRGPSVWERCLVPQARLVVCGAHGSAADFVRGLLGDSVSGGNDDLVVVDPDVPVQSFQLTFQRGADFGVSVHAQHRRLTTLMKEHESLACRAGEEGGEGVRSMNVEVHVVNSEEFFHHCCPWLLPSCTLVVLTFHVHRLLNQPQLETRRLAAMVRSVRDCGDCAGGGGGGGGSGTSSSSSSKIQLYGVPSGAQPDVSAEEIQGMFYVTDSGSRLLARQGLGVNVTLPSCGRSVAAARQALFSACESRLPQATGGQCLARVADWLWTVRGVTVSGREVAAGVVSGGVVGEGDPAAVVVQSVIQGLLETGSLLLCGSSSSSRPGREVEQDYLLAFNAVLCLSSLLVKPLLDTYSIDCRQKWFKLFATARLARSELADLLAWEGSPLSVEVLEQLGLAFKLHTANGGPGDSGFGEDGAVDYVLPYFLQDCGDGGECEEEEGYVVRLGRCVSWRGYFSMLSKLSALPATQEVVVSGQCRATLRHNALRLSLRWRKDSSCDSIFVAVGRSSRSRESVVVQELEHLFSLVIPPAVPFKVQVSDSTSPTSNLPSRDHEPAPLPSARPSALHEETFVKPVVAVESPSCPAMEEPCRGDLRLTALPWSVLNQVANRLSVPMPAGHDWRSVAELAGKSLSEILAYEAISTGGREVPAMPFLREWILTGRVQQLLDILHTLERPDVRDLILDHLRERRENGGVG